MATATQRVDVVVLDGVMASSLSVTLDVLATANRLAPRVGAPRPPFTCRVLSTNPRFVATGSGHRFAVDGVLAGRPSSLVVVPGLGLAERDDLLASLRRPATRRVIAYVREAHRRGGIVAASCSSTFLLAEAGLLDGGPATTTWWLTPFFRERYPAVELVTDRMVTTAGRVVCAGAALAQLDLMLHLVARQAGAQLARLCARYLVLEDERPSQAPYMVLEHLARTDDLVTRADAWIRAHLDRPFQLTELAKAVATSPRTLNRRFHAVVGTSPLRFARRIRGDVARNLLETTTLAVDDVAGRVGYSDVPAFRRLFRRHAGVTPGAARRARGRGGT
jgi:transcriptional regulator GlxA family with amidase domain